MTATPSRPASWSITRRSPPSRNATDIASVAARSGSVRFRKRSRIMNRQAETLETHLEAPMEHAAIAGTSLTVSRVAIGTWAIGGWMWGGTDEAQSIATIRAALDHGINLIDTAPVYGFGRSEEIVGKAIADAGLRP